MALCYHGPGQHLLGVCVCVCMYTHASSYICMHDLSLSFSLGQSTRVYAGHVTAWHAQFLPVLLERNMQASQWELGGKRVTLHSSELFDLKKNNWRILYKNVVLLL